MKINKILSSLISGAILTLPLIAMAAPPTPLPAAQTWPTIVTFIQGTLYTVGGVIIVIMIIIAGIMFITASGDPEKVQKARNTLLYAVVGGVVLVLATSIFSIISSWL